MRKFCRWFVTIWAVSVTTCVMAGEVVELKASDITETKGDGPDGVANTADDTWQFWYQHDQRGGYGLMRERKKAPKQVPDGPNVIGWVYSATPSKNRRGKVAPASDWSPEFEGIWANTNNGAIHAHPYTHHGLHAGVAFTFKVPEDGLYNVSGTFTDVAVVKPMPRAAMDGVTIVVDRTADPTKNGEVVGKTEPFGDGHPSSSAKLSLEKIALRKGQYLRISIDPNAWWATDMTKIEGLKIEKAGAQQNTPRN